MSISDDVTLANHAGVRHLLPWYANGTLNPDEHARLEAHLVACVECKRDAMECQSVSAAAKSRSPEAWEPSARHFAQLLNRVERSEKRSWTNRGRASIAIRLRTWFMSAPPWALALQCALLLAVGGVALVRSGGPVPQYQTLAHPATASDHVHLHVIFAADMSGEELRQLLHEIGAQIVDGPSPLGVYTLELPFARAARPQLQASLATVRAHPKVRFVAEAGGEDSAP
jgi:anti-sigma factor RsiW